MQLSFYKSWLIFSFFFTKKDPDFKRVLDVELIYCDCISCNWQKKRPKNSSRRRPSNWLTFTYLAPKENVHSAIFLVLFFNDSFFMPIWQNDGIFFFYWILFLSLYSLQLRARSISDDSSPCKFNGSEPNNPLLNSIGTNKTGSGKKN